MRNKITIKNLYILVNDIQNAIKIKNNHKKSWCGSLFKFLRERDILDKNLDHFLDQIPVSSGALLVRLIDLTANLNYPSLNNGRAITIRSLLKNSYVDDEYQIELSEYQKCLLIETSKNAGISENVDKIYFV